MNGKGGAGETREVKERVTGPKSAFRTLLEKSGLDQVSLGDALSKVAGFNDAKEINEVIDKVQESIEKKVSLEDAPVRALLGKGFGVIFKTLDRLETIAESGVARLPYGAGLVIDVLYEAFKNSQYGVGKFH